MERNNILTNNFSKEFKLLSKKDFSNLKEKPLFYKSSFFLFFFKKNQLNNSRLGITISRKAGNAVYRNRVKRIIREIYRTNEFKSNHFDVNTVFNTSINNRKSKTILSFEQLQEDILKAFKFISNQ